MNPQLEMLFCGDALQSKLSNMRYKERKEGNLRHDESSIPLQVLISSAVIDIIVFFNSLKKPLKMKD